MPAAHDLALVCPDVKVASYYVDMCRRAPLSPRMRAIRITKGHVNARDLLVLQNVADHFVNREIGSYCKLAHAIAIFVAVCVIPELAFELFVLRIGVLQTVAPHFERQRRVLQVTEFG